MIDDYIFEKLIFHFEHVDIYLASKKGSQEKYLIKKKDFSAQEEFKEYSDNEIAIMKDMNHPNIIKLYDVKIDSNFIYIITEYCNGGNLKEFLEKNLEVNHKALSE